MTIVEKTVPLNLIGMSDGDSVIGFRMAAGRIIFQVVESDRKGVGHQDLEEQTPRKDIRDWINRWAETMTFEPGETRESLRAEAMKAKFDS